MRYLFPLIKNDLADKMLLLGGPRQVGKTTLALSFLKNGEADHPAYFNWDNPIARKRILRQELPANEDLWVLDEIHKYKNWKNFLKGLYDVNKSKHKIMVTGSARMDV